MPTNHKALVLTVQRALRESKNNKHDVTSDPYTSIIFGKPYTVQHKVLHLDTPAGLLLNREERFIPHRLESHIPLHSGGGLVFATHKTPMEISSHPGISMPLTFHNLLHAYPYTYHTPIDSEYDDDLMDRRTLHTYRMTQPMEIDGETGRLYNNGGENGPLFNTGDSDMGINLHQYIETAHELPHFGTVDDDTTNTTHAMDDDEFRKHWHALSKHRVTPSLDAVVGLSSDGDVFTSRDVNTDLPEGIKVPHGAIHVVHTAENPHSSWSPYVSHYSYHPETEKLVNLDPLENLFSQ